MALGSEEWVARSLADANVAAIAAGVGKGVANLAAQVASVLLVHKDVILASGNGDVAGFAAGALHAVVAVVWGYGHVCFWPLVAGLAVVWLAVHLVAAVAIYAGHTPLAEMNVGPQSFVFAQVLIAHAGAVAGSAVSRHGGGAVVVVPVYEAATNGVGLADVTIAAGGVAVAAMIIEHFGQGGLMGRGATCIEDGPIPFQVVVQVVWFQGHHVGVAATAGFF